MSKTESNFKLFDATLLKLLTRDKHSSLFAWGFSDKRVSHMFDSWSLILGRYNTYNDITPNDNT
jgi:hypothetical protein